MTFIFRTDDAFLLEGKGIVMSGANESFDKQDESSIKALIGKKARALRRDSADVVVDVLDVAISRSLSGKKNISILIENMAPAFMETGSEVFSD